MHFTSVLVRGVLAASLSLGVAAIPVEVPRSRLSRPQELGGVVKMPIARRANHKTAPRQHPTSIDNGFKVGEIHYFVDVKIGTPPQKVSVVVDTGSSDTWVYGPTFCGMEGLQCFKPGDSSTAQTVPGNPPPLEFIYGVPAGASTNATFTTDDFSVAGARIQSLQFSVATSSTLGAAARGGIMGLGFDTNEAGRRRNYTYPTILDTMYTQGLIESRAFSLYLDDLDASSGALVFGGYDTKKYTGALTKFGINDTAADPRLSIPLTSLSIDSAAKHSATTSKDLWSIASNDSAVLAVLDSGSPITSIPVDAYKSFVAYLKATYNIVLDTPANSTLATVDCAFAKLDGTLGFSFTDARSGDKATIKVPYSELTLPLDDGTCAFGLQPAPVFPQNEPYIVFGDTMMRSAYIVFDYDDNSISLAQAKFNVKASHLVPIKTGS